MTSMIGSAWKKVMTVSGVPTALAGVCRAIIGTSR